MFPYIWREMEKKSNVFRFNSIVTSVDDDENDN